MPVTVPGSLLGAPKLQLFDNDGHPAALYLLHTYAAGTSTPKPTYTDVDLAIGHANTNPIELDASGRAVVFLDVDGYKLVLTDPDGAEVWTQDDVEDIGQSLFATLDTQGPPTLTAVTVSGYTALPDDQVLLVTNPSGTDPFLVNLLPAADATQRMLTIKNLGEKDLSIVPDGSDTVDLIAGAYTVPGSVIPVCPSIVLISDGAAHWYIESSHGIL